MITCRFAIMCGSVSVDATSGSLSIFNVFDEIRAAGFPLLIQSAAFVVRLRRDATDPNYADCNFRLMLNQDELGAAPLRAEFRDKPFANLIARLEGLVVTQPGSLTFTLHHNGAEIAKCEVQAYVTPTAPRIESVAQQ